MLVKLSYLFIPKFRGINVESAIPSYPKIKLKYKLQIYASIFVPLSVKVVIAFNKKVYCGLPNWKKKFKLSIEEKLHVQYFISFRRQ